jgi:hypothetical protein
MGKSLAVALATVLGLLTAGGLGLLAGLAPVFHWELAGLVVAIWAAVGGALAGAAGAASGKVGIGVAVAVLLGGGAFLLLSRGEAQPAALTLWGTVTDAAAAGVAGAVGVILGKPPRTAPVPRA